MPKTKFQSVVFTLLMVFCMVFSMTVYAISCEMGGLSYKVFSLAIKEMWIEFVILFFLMYFVISKLALKLAFRFVNPKKDREIVVIIAIQIFTVIITVPTITLIVTFLQNGFTSECICIWLEMIVKMFPMALCLQIFYIGPFVRTILNLVFNRKQIKHKKLQVSN